MAETRGRMSAQLLIGFAIVILGTLFTLDTLNILESEPILRWWPLVVVLVGLCRLLGLGCCRQVVAGALITAGGAWLLLHNLHIVRFGIWELWPLALVFAGASMVLGSVRRTKESGPAGDPADYANVFVMMGGVVRKMLSPQFRGGEVTAVMGGVELDLRNASAASDTVIIQVLVWWGGVELHVPKDWKVSGEVQPLMAGYDDQTRVEPDARTHLIVRGLIVMGGVEVKN